MSSSFKQDMKRWRNKLGLDIAKLKMFYETGELVFLKFDEQRGHLYKLSNKIYALKNGVVNCIGVKN